MKNNKGELIKLLYFIIENKDKILNENKIFNKDCLIILKAIISGNLSNEFKLTNEQKKLIIDAFIIGKNSINKKTPKFIAENPVCIKLSIERDINSINYISYKNINVKNYIIDKAINKEYILSDNSPSFLRKNFQVAQNSIKKNIKTINFIDWEELNNEDTSKLINTLINKGYILSKNSPTFLKNNVDLALNSIKKDINCVNYVTEEVMNNPKIFKYLMEKDYLFTKEELLNKSIGCYLEPEILKKTLINLGIKKENNSEEYLDKLCLLCCDAFKSKATIKKLEDVFQYVAEENWEEHRKNYSDEYDNLFGKICAELKNNNNYTNALDELTFLDGMSFFLGNKFFELKDSMQEYFNIIHSNENNKLSKIEKSRDTIAKLCALYISMCKEDYKKEQIEKYYDHINEYFDLNLNNPYIAKKIIQSRKKEEFKLAYRFEDEDICNFINELVKKYSVYYNEEFIKELIFEFIAADNTCMEDFIAPPLYYEDYKRYEKAIKLIRRLNSGYITYDSLEVLNYKDIIIYDSVNKEYVYDGVILYVDDKSQYIDYIKKVKLFEKIKKDIAFKIQTIEINEPIDKAQTWNFKEDLPFKDEFYEFNLEYAHKEIKLEQFINGVIDFDNGFNEQVFINNEDFNKIYNLLIKNNLIWLLVFFYRNPNYDLSNCEINKDTFKEIINNIKNITSLGELFNFDIFKFRDLFLVYKLSSCANNESLAILGSTIIEKIYKNLCYTTKNPKELIDMAKELVCLMSKRSKSTVPYVKGETLNYKYSLYDPLDENVLICGINTDSCFKIDGNDNDFLYYCALDKNGFVIKITDSFDNFIARASGFRNGNSIFINQLRTIYDNGGNFYTSEYKNEKIEIIKTFKKACDDIIATSHNNPLEKNKIDFAFATQSYALDDYEFGVSDEVAEAIGMSPMDYHSDDWQEFVSSTNNLQEANEIEEFTTDYGGYGIACISSYKNINDIKEEDIVKKDVLALYERKRSKIIVANATNDIAFKKINKVRAIKSYFDNSEFIPVSLLPDDIVITGDNWYIVINENQITNSMFLDYDLKAQKEFLIVKDIVNEELNKTNQTNNNIINNLSIKILSKKP